jgi:ornithine carbamoyltransferase
VTTTLGQLQGRSLTKDTDLSREEFLTVLGLAAQLRHEKRNHHEVERLSGRNVALLFEKTSTRTLSAFEVAAYDQGAHVTYLGPGESQLGQKESVKDTARVLSRMFDGIEYRGFAQADVETLAEFASVPVWNGLTDEWHPTQLLADVMTMDDHSDKALTDMVLCYVGDARNNTANSLLVTGAQLGLDVRVGAPSALQPGFAVRATADELAATSGARVTVTDDLDAAVQGADFLYTDVWLSMGEPEESWDERVRLLYPYQVNAKLLARTRNPDVKVLHCLPALHDAGTEVGKRVMAKYRLDALEITDEVFESKASIVFDQAENRLHTIKALMVSTVGEV